jgi:hypothetical protein
MPDPVSKPPSPGKPGAPGKPQGQGKSTDDQEVRRAKAGYANAAGEGRELSHRLEEDEKTAAKLLVQLEDVETGDPWAYLTTKSRSMYYSGKDDCRQLLAFKAEKITHNVGSADPLDTELLKFEKRYSRLLGTEGKAQYAQNAVAVMEERDRLMTGITRALLDQLGVDIVSFETFDASISSNISNFIGMCDSFNSLSKVSLPVPPTLCES